MIDKAFITSLDRKGASIGAAAGAALFLVSLLVFFTSGPAPQSPLAIPDVIQLKDDHEQPNIADTQVQDEPEAVATAPVKKIIRLVVENIPANAKVIEGITDLLPPTTSMALSPYTAQLKTRINDLRDQGRDVWVMLPTQTVESAAISEDMGPTSIHLNQQDDNNIRTASNLAAQVRQASGLLVASNSSIPSRIEAWRPISAALKELNVTVADMTTTPIAGDVLNSPHYIKGTMTLDNPPLRSQIAKKLEELQNYLQTYDEATISISAYPISLKVISEWIESIDMNLVELKPLSSLVTLKSEAFQAINTTDQTKDSHDDGGHE